MPTFLQLIPRLRNAGVDFVIIGGVAAIAHGGCRHTTDLDVVAPMELENLQRVIRAIQDLSPRFRMRPDLPIVTPDNHNLRGLKNLYLITDLGPLDILGYVEGVGDYATIAKTAVELDLAEYGLVKVIDLYSLLAAKKAVGRPKDILSVAELEVIRKRREGGPPPPLPE